MTSQVRFRIVNADLGNINKVLGGIAIYEDGTHLVNVICGCCGDMFEPEDVEILEVFPWISISDAILGN